MPQGAYTAAGCLIVSAWIIWMLRQRYQGVFLHLRCPRCLLNHYCEDQIWRPRPFLYPDKRTDQNFCACGVRGAFSITTAKIKSGGPGPFYIPTKVQTRI